MYPVYATIVACVLSQIKSSEVGSHNNSRSSGHNNNITTEASNKTGRSDREFPAAPSDSEFPYIVSLQTEVTLEHECGGILLTPSHVLTACHCLLQWDNELKDYRSKDPSSISLLAGSVNVDFESKDAQRRFARILSTHPRCKNFTPGWYYDFGIVTVDQDFTMNKGTVEVVRLPHFHSAREISKMAEDQSECVAAGWGVTDSWNSIPRYYDELMKFHVKLLPMAKCTGYLKTVEKTKNGHEIYLGAQLCAIENTTKGVCFGDSGAPLTCMNRGERMLTAIVSWGVKCGTPNKPKVWARIDVAERWIREVIDSGCHAGNNWAFIFGLLLTLIPLCSCRSC